MRKFLSCLLIIFLLGSNIAFGAQKEVRVYVNGVNVYFADVKPYINSAGRTMVPMRKVFEEMGAKVDWIDKEKAAVYKLGGKEVKIRIGEKRALVNGKYVDIDSAAELKNARTLVPLRFISETLGATVKWDEKSWSVFITTSKEQPLMKTIEEIKNSSNLKTIYVDVGSIEDEEVQRGEKLYVDIMIMLPDVWGPSNVKPLEEQYRDAKKVLLHFVDEKTADEVIAYVRQKDTKRKELPFKSFYYGNWRIEAGGSLGNSPLIEVWVR
ncbi:Protease inhibitor [Fervidicola ferrireducens]|uniref:Protease inhibitor n=1 Tax=Fervidicola ferrireducens TaxID=520764 RepID=A0A140L0B4_9FIRM|nr:copper amine oxidase N-terminal domain-containing protein [Fervidicola ferrireducens]KXG73989.1 Protease inhibitor [Fervidicola ferrireducens]